ncbi:MAG: HNH endonuclease [Methanomicrobiaceae archaeon]|uniref:HNH endonuclease n=1 Tax=Methanoculleus sp. TaxID=90427 RepID=UPI0032111C0B|nr:HNH endonuclease [Methanomicrobiaceae archaeon]
MTSDLQLSLDAFDCTQPPLCNGRPDQNGFLRLCWRCPFAVRERGAVFCEEFGVVIRARAKYGLRGWREIRTVVLDRDGGVCAVCGSGMDLHVHHIDLDPTNDAPENLITLCGICHARVHTGLRREGGAERVARVILAARRRADRTTYPDLP